MSYYPKIILLDVEFSKKKKICQSEPEVLYVGTHALQWGFVLRNIISTISYNISEAIYLTTECLQVLWIKERDQGTSKMWLYGLN